MKNKNNVWTDKKPLWVLKFIKLKIRLRAKILRIVISVLQLIRDLKASRGKWDDDDFNVENSKEIDLLTDTIIDKIVSSYFATCPEEPDGLWIMDFLDLKSIKSIIHGFEMDLDLQIKTPWILDGFGFTKEIHEIHEIHEFRSSILIIRNNDKLIIQ